MDCREFTSGRQVFGREALKHYAERTLKRNGA